MTDREVGAVVDRFNKAWSEHDLEGAVSLVTQDCVFESTDPAPDGRRYEGKEAVRGAWVAIFSDPASRFTVEESFTTDDKVVQRWRYDWDGGHVRGVDLISVRNGKVSAKLSYVKG
jgi:uncharacterized protein (TIGR02246 family)